MERTTGNHKILTGSDVWGSRERGSVVIPACNEAAVIERTLTPLSRAAVEGYIELVVVCNGCTDRTAAIASGVPGVRVLDLAEGSKPAALNAGDAAARLWPRLYLDADIQISPRAVLSVLDRLSDGDVLAARPPAEYDYRRATPAVRRYYKARQRVSHHKSALWGAGVYGLSREGHQRLGQFPNITGDDLYVDRLFQAHEKAVVVTDPAIIRVPVNTSSLLAILRRGNRGNAELVDRDDHPAERIWNSGLHTALAVIASVRTPDSAADAMTYLAISLAARRQRRATGVWERDESSRE